MMGPAHSLSGAAAWLGVGAAAAATGHTMPWPVLVVGALITAGAALAPDLDHKSATISRAFGPVSKLVCEVVDKISYAVYKATRGGRRPPAHRRPPHPHPHLAVGGPHRGRRLWRRDPRRTLGGPRDPLRPPGARRRRAALAGRPRLQRRTGLAARRDQRLDPRRRAGPARPRLELVLRRARPGVHVARAADPPRCPRPRHRRRPDGLGLPDPLAHPARSQAVVRPGAPEGDAVPGRAAGWS